MKDKFVISLLLGIWCLVLLCSAILANTTYGRLELRAFNKINHTTYTMDVWRVYEYDIKKAHPFGTIPEGMR